MTTTLSRMDLAVRIDAKPFAAACTWAAKRIPTRPTNPVLAAVMLDVAGGRLSVSAFDWDTASRAELDVTSGNDSGRVLVSGRLLAEYVKTFPDKPVDITVNNNRVFVKCGTITVSLPTMPVEDYPALPSMPAAIGTIDAETFVTAIGRVVVAADRDGSSGVAELTGVHLRFDGGQLHLEGSDRYRGAIAIPPWRPARAGVDTALVPSLVLEDVGRTFDGTSGDITIAVDDNLVGFTGRDRSIVTRLLGGQFPPRFSNLFPQRADSPAVVTVADLAAALNRARIVHAPKSPARLDFADNAITVRAKGDDTNQAEGGEVVECQYDGAPITLGVNPQYLLDGLNALRSRTAEITFTSPRRPVLLTVPDAEPMAYRHLVVPIDPDRIAA